MTDAEIWNSLNQIFRDVFDDPDIVVAPGTTAADIEGWDLLTHIQLMVAIERHFAIRFNTGEVAGLANVGEMTALIAQRAS